ncbi:ABC transporter permease [Pseudoduganella aquatica]|uniref:ABC transporter permease subunit n=1 Tax=Pseudoduganella aquatica TaxID=2660641 RepID=A0A7X4HD35_9BURK|nr:ABC transporter permease [Pseudoduganella aquatica]MYN08984.1 ABC transporter permease subunit [Pseudoduganella aquatica]
MQNTHAAPGLWALAWRRLRADRVAMVALAIVGAFMLLLVLSASGLIVSDWEEEVGINYAPPSFAAGVADVGRVSPPGVTRQAPPPPNEFDPLAEDLQALQGAPAPEVDMHGVADPLADDLKALRAQLPGAAGPAAERLPSLPFGGDKWGHDVIKKTIKGAETSIVVGLVAALVAVGLGTLFGAVSGFYGGLVDDFFNWFYSIFTSIPSILMILTVAAVLQQKGVMTIVLILGLTGWTGPYRLIRAEYIKHKAREYVMAADAIGASSWRKMFSHIFPNVSHVALVQMSILVVGFIKAEVILSFLGFGVPVGVVSWGSMLNEAQNELILGKWWQLTAAATAMALLVTAFSLFTDALRDALDPKVK